MQTNHIVDRRKALSLVATMPAAAVLGTPAFALEDGGELAELVRHYFSQVDAFNSASDMDDDDMNRLANATYKSVDS